MAMDVARAPSITDPTESEERAQAMRNAVSQMQARYGEKPKEARQIKKTLDKDDFMRIMITEMKNQDPTKPMDSDRMATQMAQLTSVEQLKNVGSAIEKLADKNNATDRLAMSTMIGKSVTVDKGRFNHQKGTLSSVNFDLPTDAAKISLVVLDERGEEVSKHELEPMKAGQNTYNWDGLNESKLPSNSGTYMVRIDAEDKNGARISVNPMSQETIVGVTFEGGEANFLVGDPKSPQRVAFKSVTRIQADDQLSARAASAKAAQRQELQQNAEKAANGQAPSGLSSLPPGLQEKLKAEMAEKGVSPDQQVAQTEKPAEDVKPEGFPNGLAE